MFCGIGCVFAGPKDASLTEEQKSAVSAYVGYFHDDINSSLMEEMVVEPYLGNIIKTLSSAINSLGSVQNRPLYKGKFEQTFIGVNKEIDLSKDEPINLIGEKIRFRGFTSTSSDINVALSYSCGKILYIINPVKKRALDINQAIEINVFSYEKEFLFDKNQMFRIVNVEKDKSFLINDGSREYPIEVKTVITLEDVCDFHSYCRI